MSCVLSATHDVDVGYNGRISRRSDSRNRVGNWFNVSEYQ